MIDKIIKKLKSVEQKFPGKLVEFHLFSDGSGEIIVYDPLNTSLFPITVLIFNTIDELNTKLSN